MTTPTPRTNEVVRKCYLGYANGSLPVLLEELAKQLERDLAAAQAELALERERAERAEAQAEKNARDAERYRWLRNPTLPVAIYINNKLPFAVDTAIDGAMNAAGVAPELFPGTLDALNAIAAREGKT